MRKSNTDHTVRYDKNSESLRYQGVVTASGVVIRVYSQYFDQQKNDLDKMRNPNYVPHLDNSYFPQVERKYAKQFVIVIVHTDQKSSRTVYDLDGNKIPSTLTQPFAYGKYKQPSPEYPEDIDEDFDLLVY
jgi:hypothetical protein